MTPTSNATRARCITFAAVFTSPQLKGNFTAPSGASDWSAAAAANGAGPEGAAPPSDWSAAAGAPL
eukprot:1180670-Prorocentrum_minimum.AAC.7